MSNGQGHICELHLFASGWVEDDRGDKIMCPICPRHPEVRVLLERTPDGQVMVTCAEEPAGVLNMCSQEDFDAERKIAEAQLANYQ